MVMADQAAVEEQDASMCAGELGIDFPKHAKV